MSTLEYLTLQIAMIVLIANISQVYYGFNDVSDLNYTFMLKNIFNTV